MSDRQHPKIVLSPTERLLREFLLDCAEHFPGLEIWVTGGWVRDRLLGLPSSDLDFGLSNVTGRQMGKLLVSLSAQPEFETKYRQKAADLGIPDFQFSSFHTIKRNEELPNKLETSGGRLFGLDIDLVNLRKEIYAGDSRTPEMKFGTPEEDAFRRDATVNSLFFHLAREEVVDHTGRGLGDLEAKVLRTPLASRQTFMEDPLRILRLIRIASKLSFDIDPAVVACMKEPEVQQALDKMVKRDRVNIELLKIMNGPSPGIAFQYIFDANLYTPVFLRLDSPLVRELTEESTAFGLPTLSGWPRTWQLAYQTLGILFERSGNLSKLISSEGEPAHLWIMAAYAPLARLRHTKLQAIVEEMTVAIKATRKLSRIFETALANFDTISDLVGSVNNYNGRRKVSRSQVGMMIRSWGGNWATQLAYVMLAEVASDTEPAFTLLGPMDNPNTPGLFTGRILQRYTVFADLVYEQDLEQAQTHRPLLDGNQIQDLFGLRQGGKYLRLVADELLAWQFDNPDKGIEEAKLWLLDQRIRLGIPLVEEI